ncbi:hypothetical protein CLAIMM_15104 [Cladophialophora immunda]|nr:hypothetical protein CLAIMM_15104 [Cladophialophora immunda]
MASPRRITYGSPPNEAGLTLLTDSLAASSLSSTTPREQNVPPLVDETDKARMCIRVLLGGRDIGPSDKPEEFVIPVSSFHELLNDPEAQSDLERRVLPCVISHCLLTLRAPRLKRKISYDARKSIFTIFPMTGQIHASVLDWLTVFANHSRYSIAPSANGRPRFANNANFNDFEGEWSGSLQAPDFAVFWKDNTGNPLLHTIVEVGCSQSRDALLGLRDAYMNGIPCLSRFIGISVIETPPYASPINIDIDGVKEFDMAAVRFDSPQGPFWYKEVHEIRIPFFEIPATIAPNAEPVTIKPADMHGFWRHDLDFGITLEARVRMNKYVKSVKKQREDAANIAKEDLLARNKRQKDNEERTKRWRNRHRG